MNRRPNFGREELGDGSIRGVTEQQGRHGRVLTDTTRNMEGTVNLEGRQSRDIKKNKQ